MPYMVLNTVLSAEKEKESMPKGNLRLCGAIGLVVTVILVPLLAACAGEAPEAAEVVATPAGWTGGYLGVETCAVCHDGSFMPDVVSNWQETGHATKFEETFERYGENTAYCIACHTVGYDEEKDSGGFDDLARAAGWDPATENIGSWVASKGLDGVSESAAGRLMNVQCESCHGGATNEAGDMHQYSVDWSPNACDACHGQIDQLENAGHVEGIHVGAAYQYASGNDHCANCHSGQGYVVMTIRGEEAVFPDKATLDQPANMLVAAQQPAIGCPTCHDPHKATFPEEEALEDGGVKVFSKQLRAWGRVTIPAGVTIDAGISATCVNCHANKRDVQYQADFLAGKNSRGPHANSQTDAFYGVGAVDFDGALTTTNSVHTTLAEHGCVTCHMAPTPGLDSHADPYDPEQPGHNQLGGHSFAMTIEEEDGTVVENVGIFIDGKYAGGSCMTEGCHAQGTVTTFNRTAYGDYDGDGTVEGVQDEVQGLLDILAAELPKDDEGNIPSSGIDTMNLTKTQLSALWNYILIRDEGSLGIHNTAFAVQVLQKTYKQLTGIDVPGATLR